MIKSNNTIFTKTVESIDDIMNAFTNACTAVNSTMQNLTKDSPALNSYEDWVEWALTLCVDNIPSPFSIKHGFMIYLGKSFFTLSIPNEFKVGIKVSTRNSDTKYVLDITYLVNENIMKNTNDYDELIENGWTIKNINKNKDFTPKDSEE